VTGRIDVHSHLLPGIDDGCESVEESLRCARRMVAAGYTHSFVTPHIWPGLPANTIANITALTQRLQAALDRGDIPLRLIPGGELNLSPTLAQTPREELITYGMQRHYLLFDLWANRLPAYFEPTVRWLQSQGLQVILAHPERMQAVQDDPALADYFARLNILLQGNLQCFNDPRSSPTRRTADRFLREGRYFMLGSDLHREDSLQSRLDGLQRARELAGEQQIDELTIANPAKLLSRL
jgi:protein-tyrosine phosphatase